MPQTPHIERHFTAGDTVRDIVIGMADGLTVPFALAAGLSGAAQSTAVIVTAGLAEIAAGSIAMGLGGYLAGRSDAEHYASERAREAREVVEKAEAETQEVSSVFESYGLSTAQITPILDALQRQPEAWIDFMMRFELGLERPDPRRAYRSALTIGAAYVVGGIIPLAPYLLSATTGSALTASVSVTAVALLLFGAVKARFTGTAPLRGALQTVLVGGLAAAAAFLLARLLG
ncbi:MAG TPA: VIT1/CCC1 transporter family protein [bacterium]